MDVPGVPVTSVGTDCGGVVIPGGVDCAWPGLTGATGRARAVAVSCPGFGVRVNVTVGDGTSVWVGGRGVSDGIGVGVIVAVGSSVGVIVGVRVSGPPISGVGRKVLVGVDVARSGVQATVLTIAKVANARILRRLLVAA